MSDDEIVKVIQATYNRLRAQLLLAGAAEGKARRGAVALQTLEQLRRELMNDRTWVVEVLTRLQESAPEYMDIDPCGRQTSVLNERQTMLLSMGEAMDGAPEKKHITRRDQDMHKGAVEGTKPSDSPHHGNPQGPGIDENGWPNDPIATARDRIGANVDQSEGG
jgi:hypothetical protein